VRLRRDLENIKSRGAGAGEAVTNAVRQILDGVKRGGIAAAKKYAETFDGFKGAELLVNQKEIGAAVKRVGADFMRILNRAREQIKTFHLRQVEASWDIKKDDGVILGQVVRPLQRVALYVPGGTAAYPSTVLMNAVPAQIAGVPELYILTPVKKDGKAADVILAAAAACGIDKIYVVRHCDNNVVIKCLSSCHQIMANVFDFRFINQTLIEI
jgi:histidinol dehydrogenase